MQHALVVIIFIVALVLMILAGWLLNASTSGAKERLTGLIIGCIGVALLALDMYLAG